RRRRHHQPARRPDELRRQSEGARMTAETNPLTTTLAVRPAGKVRRTGVTRRILRRPGALLCLAWIGAVLIGSIVFRAFDIGQPLKQDLANSLKLPSADHLLGTDLLGRDVFSRL